MADPKVILWTSIFYKGDSIKVGIGWCLLLNVVKNSYSLDKFAIKLVAL